MLFPPLCLLDEGTEPLSGVDADSDPAKAAAESSEMSGAAGVADSDVAAGSGGGSIGSSAQSDALTKEQKLKLRWKTLELLGGK